ncbi:hypothetical protein KFU94_53460 [Chloroflexi bacterium TSY]|nr:hypothetical protein [Chloroflexi bacterium TSY]
MAKIAAASPFQHGPDFSWHGSVTNQSGKVHLVHFRRSCDKEFRYFSQQLARSSRQQSRWLRLTLHKLVKGPLGQSLIGL